MNSKRPPVGFRPANPNYLKRQPKDISTKISEKQPFVCISPLPRNDHQRTQLSAIYSQFANLSNSYSHNKYHKSLSASFSIGISPKSEQLMLGHIPTHTCTQFQVYLSISLRVISDIWIWTLESIWVIARPHCEFSHTTL